MARSSRWRPTTAISWKFWWSDMRIRIETNGRRYVIRIPTGMLVNGLTATVMARSINRKSGKEEPVLSGEAARALARELRACRKRFCSTTIRR